MIEPERCIVVPDESFSFVFSKRIRVFHHTRDIPQQFKMALFNHRDILGLQADATLHNKEVAANGLQPYNDLLFKIVCNHVRARRDTILEDIRKKIQDTPGKVVAVSVPLWSYNVRYFYKTREQYNAEIRDLPLDQRFARLEQDDRLRLADNVNGWNWTIGAEFDGEVPPRSVSPLEPYVPEVYDDLPAVPVDLIVRKTDLLKRLSTTLFPGYGWVFVDHGEPIHTDDRREVRKRTLYVLYSVSGNDPGNYKNKSLQPVAVKYATHQDYKVQDDHRVVLRGPGLAPPQTPLRQDTPPAIPGAPRRERCDGVDIMTYDSE